HPYPGPRRERGRVLDRRRHRGRQRSLARGRGNPLESAAVAASRGRPQGRCKRMFMWGNVKRKLACAHTLTFTGVMRHRDSIDTASVRNLDEIQEAEHDARPNRLGALVLASLGGACIVFAAVALLKAPAPPKPVVVDPLSDLVAKTRPAGQEKR